MTLRSIITRTVLIALAATALAAPAASARPADLPPALAKAVAADQQSQSLPSSDANGAGSRDRRDGLRREYPTRPAQGEQANPRLDTSLQTPADGGITWTTIGFVAAAYLLALAAIAGVVRGKRRDRRPRITA